ncbi:MAG TPA: hypothetical protein VLA52_18290 [Thermohalobaculum sp.]|nr:hypothetical protein [Thermohalobaculum sp.]
MTEHALVPDSRNYHAAVWVGAIAFAWAAIVVILANNGMFDAPPDQPPRAILVAVTGPVMAFLAAMWLSPRLRGLALGLDPVLLTEMQSWRILGGLFLAVYAFGHLPGLFAWPAGLGDVAIGVAAPFVALSLRRNRAALASGRFRLFHYLGLLDFAIAVGAGVLSRNVIPGLVDGVTSAAMGQLPLVLIPAVAVPSFIILHLIVLMQSARKE